MEFLTCLRERWERIFGLALIALGPALVLAAYQGVGESPQLVAQLSYIISGGAGGLLALGVGITLLICGDLREEFEMLDRVEMALRPDAMAAREATDQTSLPSPGEPNRHDEPGDGVVLIEMKVATRPR